MHDLPSSFPWFLICENQVHSEGENSFEENSQNLFYSIMKENCVTISGFGQQN